MLERLQSKAIQNHLVVVLDSFESCFNKRLIGSGLSPVEMVEAIWKAEFVLVSHGVESDPVFNFGNEMALRLFELDFDAFTRLPSRKSAEMISREERQRLLDEVAARGCISDYTGIRISSSGRRFYIENAKVWNLYDGSQEYYGQAAMFKSWKYLG
ncbi:MEKHLA domain-containing protein [uncultured Endozoicomonas sp.]|uniref:MEKHLA domain-containing protein n=1 Tax=uncultured Endozoicomonas sp. TaxID=432652 RepID=UPI0026252812|nr:MEKHLA domain-containing protein [uncultured Endozoicomonas sp.]